MAGRLHGDLEMNYRRGLTFLQLAVEQLRPYDSRTAARAFDIPLKDLLEAFETVSSRLHHDRSANYTMDPYAHALQASSDNLFEEITSRMALAPPGLGRGILPEAPAKRCNARGLPQNDNPTRHGSGGPAWSLPWAGTSDLREGSDLLGNDRPAVALSGYSSTQGTTRSRGSNRAAPFGVIGEHRSASTSRRASGISSSHHAADIVEASAPANPEASIADGGSNSRGRFTAALEGVAKRAESRSLSRARALVNEEYSERPSTNRDSSNDTIPLHMESRTTSFDSPEEEGMLIGLEPHCRTSLNARLEAQQGIYEARDVFQHPKLLPVANTQKPAESVTWAKVAAISPSAHNISSKFGGSLTMALSSAQTRLNQVPAHVNLARQETEAERLRVVWISNLPATFTIRDVSNGIEFGPLLSILIQAGPIGTLKGHIACVIFQQAAHAEAFLTRSKNQLNPAGHTYPQAPQVSFQLGDAYPIDEGLAAMEAPTFARRRLKWSRARLFYEVSIAHFKSDVMRVCGARNVEMCHFYNPGECTIVFASVQVAMVVYKFFEAVKEEADSLYNGVEVAYVHDFNEAPATLYTQYGPHGLFGGRLTGGYAGPVVPEETEEEPDF